MVRTALSLDDEASLLAEARERPKSVYLLVGESFQTESAARALIDVLVPPEGRSFNLEMYHGRTTPITTILNSLRMRGFFPGTKVVWVREPTLFLSAEKRTDISTALFAAWSDERHAEAADRLLTLAAMAGWSQERFAEIDWEGLSETSLKDLLGRVPDAEERRILAAVRAYCIERDFAVATYHDESDLLETFIKSGMPAGSVALFTAAEVDHRKRIVKTIASVGTVLDLTLERERSGALSLASIDRVIDRVLRRNKKRLSPAARRSIHQRSGPDAAALALEVEKLCLYAGEAEEITEEDVRASFRDLAESWIFDFTRALTRGEAANALRLLRGLFAQGEPPLRLLALLARELRLLLLARDCLNGGLAGRWSPGVTFAAFRDRLWPQLEDQERDAFSGVHPYVTYLAFQNASRIATAVLQRGILRLQQLDRKLKSSAGDPRILLEAFVLEFSGAVGQGEQAVRRERQGNEV